MPGDNELSDLTADADTPRPYGPFGLVVSIVLILLATALLSAFIVAAIFAVAFVVLGHQQMMDRIAVLDPSNGDGLSREKLGIVVSLIGYAALALAILAAARLRGGARGWREIVGWRPWTGWRSWRIWGLAVLMVVYSLVATTALSHYFPKFDASIKLPDGKGWALVFLLLASVLAPIGEEFLFRGLALHEPARLVRRGGGRPRRLRAVCARTLGSTHLYALAVFPVGLGLALIRERTDSIKASIVVHGSTTASRPRCCSSASSAQARQ